MPSNFPREGHHIGMRQPRDFTIRIGPYDLARFHAGKDPAQRVSIGALHRPNEPTADGVIEGNTLHMNQPAFERFVRETGTWDLFLRPRQGILDSQRPRVIKPDFLAALNYARFKWSRQAGADDAYSVILTWFAFWVQTCYQEFGEDRTAIITKRG